MNNTPLFVARSGRRRRRPRAEWTCPAPSDPTGRPVQWCPRCRRCECACERDAAAVARANFRLIGGDAGASYFWMCVKDAFWFWSWSPLESQSRPRWDRIGAEMSGLGFKIPELRLPSQLTLSHDAPRHLLPVFHAGGPSSVLLAPPHGPTPRRRHSWICRWETHWPKVIPNGVISTWINPRRGCANGCVIIGD